MGNDPVLNQINKKTWNHTKPIMICNVLAFFSILGVIITLVLDASPLIPLILNILFIIFAIHNAWLLEEKL